MDKIKIWYWKEKDLVPKLPHGFEVAYSVRKQNKIVQTILNLGLSAMLRPFTDEGVKTLVIYIDKGRFGQS